MGTGLLITNGQFLIGLLRRVIERINGIDGKLDFSWYCLLDVINLTEKINESIKDDSISWNCCTMTAALI